MYFIDWTKIFVHVLLKILNHSTNEMFVRTQLKKARGVILYYITMPYG